MIGAVLGMGFQAVRAIRMGWMAWMVGSVGSVGMAQSVPGWLGSAEDPLGPVDQLPDASRDLACVLTASDAVCSPPDPDPPDFDLQPPADVAGAGSFGTLLVVLLVAALVVAVVWMIVSVVRNRAPLDDVDDDEVDEQLDDVVDGRIVDVERPPDRWRRTAVEHRAAGRFRDAVRCEYRALVGDLARAGHVDEIPGRTSGEEREQVRALAPGVASAFDLAADIFDGAWFDDAEVTADDDGRFVAASTAVLDDVLISAASRSTRERSRR